MEPDQNDPERNVLPGYNDFASFTKQAYPKLIAGSQIANTLPTSAQWVYFSSYNSFQTAMESNKKKALACIQKLFNHVNFTENLAKYDLAGQLKLMNRCNNNMMNQISCNIDKLEGINDVETSVVKRTPVIKTTAGSWNKLTTSSTTTNPALLPSMNIEKPQMHFSDKIDNRNELPWEPRIKDKPNSIKPLALFVEVYDGITQYTHPYELELENFTPNEELLTPIANIERFKSVSETPLKFVDDIDAIDEMLKDLLKQDVIAIDLEHHSYRTFQGITCLMQISTKHTDYLIDTLKLRNDLQPLNEAFTKPTILKVFHGAKMDIDWLQRDLSLYVVNMFDTYHAAKLLNFPQLSLACLMNTYCDHNPDKTYQLADWRIRPLPDALKSYAREDTHFLIFIYEKMRNELIAAAKGDTNLLEAVFARSKEVCMQRYKKPQFTEDSYKVLYHKSRKVFDNRQLYALKELYRWRDQTARDCDESCGYVLPNHFLVQMADLLPREIQGILACCNPVPPLVRTHLVQIHQIILKARQQSVIQPILQDEPITQRLQSSNVVTCPHDFTKMVEFNDALPTLLGQTGKNPLATVEKPLTNEKLTMCVNVFDKVVGDKQRLKIKFVSPYERYVLTQQYLKSKAEKEALIAAKNVKIEKSTENDDNLNANVKELTGLYEKQNKNLEKALEKMAKECDDTVIVNLCESNDQLDTTANSLDFETAAKLCFNETNRKRNYDDAFESVGEETLTSKQKKARKYFEKMKAKKNMNKRIFQSNAECDNESNRNKKDPEKGKKNRPKNKQNDGENSAKKKFDKNHVQPFDYSSVDFKKFKGGSTATQLQNSKLNGKKSNKFKSSKGKGSKKFQKQFDKTFGKM